jgi:PAS domain S-box-containing protein
MNEPEHIESILRERTHKLKERVKELKCLYAISDLLVRHGMPLEEVLEKAVNIIPPAWQHPEITVARIIFRQQIFQTDKFNETIWRQSSDIVMNDDHVGTAEVFYQEERPELDEGPFLAEERSLLDNIAQKLGQIIWRKSAVKSLRESEERYRILAEKVADGVTLVQDDRFLFVNHAFLDIFGFMHKEMLIGKKVTDLKSSIGEQLAEEICRSFETRTSGESFFVTSCLNHKKQKFWVEGHHNIIGFNGKPTCLSTFRDITERKLREHAAKTEAEHLRIENRTLRFSTQDRYRFGNIIGKSQPMQKVYELILKAACSDASVIIYGESGTGKELVAQAINEKSNRAGEEFVAVNCAAIPNELLEGEFFGHKKGAFTGAYTDKPGYVELASGGTLFLDEIAELSLRMQVKLLRTVDSGEYSPVGSNQTKNSNFRIVAATNKDLMEQVKMGLMREDFFYRIHVISITLPPLKDRKEDIPLLVDHFLKLQGDRNKSARVSGRIMDSLLNYHWPGNVRELQNVLQRYIALGRLDFIDSIPPAQMPEELNPKRTSLHDAVENLEIALITEALNQSRWNKSKTAGILGISRRALYRRLERFEIL